MLAHDDPVDAFASYLAEFDITPSVPLIADGELHRCHVQGHAKGSRNLAYIIHADDHAAGWFQEFKSGITKTWQHQAAAWFPDPAAQRRVAEARRQREEQAHRKHERIARLAGQLWDRAPPCDDHPYLARKRVKAHGLRVGDWRLRHEVAPGRVNYRTVADTLLIPLRAASGALWNLQGIFPALDPELGRDKTFLPGRKQGLFFWIGRKTDTLMLCEGYATAASVFAATGLQTFIAFDAGNLLPVALTLRQRRPEARIVICGDNDHQTPGNPGLTAAQRAADAVDGWLSVPTFPPGCPGSDWNDAAKMEHGHD
jgi:putative DNA primase/helicase